MENIKLKSIKLIPTTKWIDAVVYVEQVNVTATSDSVYMPNLEKTQKEELFGRVVYTADEHKDLIGKIIVIDPWRQTPIRLGGKSLIKLPEGKATYVVEGEDNE